MYTSPLLVQEVVLFLYKNDPIFRKDYFDIFVRQKTKYSEFMGGYLQKKYGISREFMFASYASFCVFQSEDAFNKFEPKFVLWRMKE